jgi:hypothetical protein
MSLLLIIFNFVLIFNFILIFIHAKIPQPNQIIYINSSKPIVIKPTYISYSNNFVPSYYITLNNTKNNFLGGSIFQVSNVYSKYGYNPIQGKKIINSTKIFDKYGRFVYLTNNLNHKGLHDKIDIKITSPSPNQVFTQIIYILPNSGIIVSNDFLFGIEDWKIIGSNPLKNNNNNLPIHNKHSSKNMSYFISWTDDFIDVDNSDSDDKSLWYFRSGEKFNNNLEISYDGNIQFIMTSFSGNFSNQNDLSKIPFVIIYCNNLDYNIFYYYHNHKTNLNNYDGSTKKFNIKLNNSRWKKILTKKNIQDNLTQKEFINCLKDINYIDILGDWTRGIETIGLDSFVVTVKK